MYVLYVRISYVIIATELKSLNVVVVITIVIINGFLVYKCPMAV